MAANRVVLWRHGQTDWNVVNRFQGHSDIDLNEVGVFQAKHAAQILAGMNPTAIISSDLGRARNTAQALADITGLSVEIDPDLRETDGGLWEGKTGAENRAEDFQNFIRWIDGEDNPAGTTGEKRSDVATRAVSAIKRALGDLDNQLLVKSLVVTTPEYLDPRILPNKVKEEYIEQYRSLLLQLPNTNEADEYNESDPNNFKSVAKN
jgi:probable phosphoglycerate mutase